MKRFITIFLMLIVIIFNFQSVKVNAKEEDGYTKEMSEEEGEEAIKEILEENEEALQALYDYIDKEKLDVEIMNELDPVEYIKSYIKNGEGNLSFTSLLKGVVSLIFKEVGSVLALALSLISIAIISTLIKNLQDSFKNNGIA